MRSHHWGARVAGLLTALTVLVVLLVASPGPDAAAADTVVAPSADATVAADQPTVNFGTATDLRADASPVMRSYLSFNVTGLTAPPTRAVLRFYSRSSGTTATSVSAVADTTWTETGITYNNAPPLGPVLGNTGPLTANAYVSVDVTPQVQANGRVSVALTSAATAVRLADSREAANPPQLVITPAGPPSSDPVVAAVGDVACEPSDPGFNGGAGTPGHCHEMATSDLVLGMSPAPAATLMLGDPQYNAGSSSEFAASYNPSWGRLKAATKPTIGNHEYGTTGAGGYFGYFGDAATPLQPGCRSNCNGWYSFDVGTWHVVSLNTECARISGGAGCASGSPQQQWLDADLASHRNSCTMVMEHRPPWSSNSFASPDVAPLVQTMYNRGVDVLLTGHSHTYERFAPQNPSANRDDARGISEFLVGTGGRDSSGFATVAPNSIVRRNNIFGVLKLTLHATGYDWSYAWDPSTPFADSGSGTCH